MTSNTIGTCYVLNRSYDPERWSVVTYNNEGICESTATVELGAIINDGRRNMFELTDGNFIILLASYHQLNKVSPQGTTIWSRSYPISSTGYGAKNMICENDFHYIFCGSGGLGVFTLVKTNSEGMVSNEDHVLNKPHAKISHFPNPVNDRATVRYETDYARGSMEFELYNIRGQKLFSIPTTDNVGSFEIDIHASNTNVKQSGVYYYVLRNGTTKLATGKMVIIK
ncbi:MAG TPA: T9SS type A sorting domain-containing protein [Candidatus Cloacimonadota bacterium]|nr:T9SS type A sorting domain-containing protein [Candidatus Cloacimonadota bacterium]